MSSRPVGRPPVIVLGMHRSGTSLVVRLMERLGLFVGAKTQMDEEAVFFRRLNDWLFHQAGAYWDHPLPMLDLLADERLHALTVEYLKHVAGTIRRASYLGFARALRHSSLLHLTAPWGWKDPRNSFTLPIWVEVFGSANVIHVVRHGVDVAASLRARQQKRLDNEERWYRKVKLVYSFRDKKNRFSESLRCSALEGGLGLWGEYLDSAQRNLELTGCTHTTVRYESLLQEPVPHTISMAAFCGLAPSESEVRAAVSGIRPDRAFAFTRSPEPRNFAEPHAGLPELRGYGPEGGTG